MIDENITMEELKQSLLRGAACDAFRKNTVSSEKTHAELNAFNFPFQDFEPVLNVFWTEQALIALKQVITVVWSHSSLDNVYVFERDLLCAERDIRQTYSTDKIEWNDIEGKNLFKAIDLGDGVSMVYFKSNNDMYIIANIWNNEILQHAMEQFQQVINYRNQNNK